MVPVGAYPDSGQAGRRQKTEEDHKAPKRKPRFLKINLLEKYLQKPYTTAESKDPAASLAVVGAYAKSR